jgi:hypothetical protein
VALKHSVLAEKWHRNVKSTETCVNTVCHDVTSSNILYVIIATHTEQGKAHQRVDGSEANGYKSLNLLQIKSSSDN